MKKILLFSYLFMNMVWAQGWVQTFGGTASDKGNAVQQTEDGGYIITGRTQSFGNGNADIWLIKTDSQGDTVWTKTFGGSSREVGYSVQQTADGGYIIVGTWLIKTDSQGNEEWINESISGVSVQQTTDGGYIITETNSSDDENGDVWLIKTDSQGQEEWIQTYGENSLIEQGTSVQQTTDGGYIITGVVAYYDEYESVYYGDVLLLKTDSQGDTLWTNTLGSEDINIGNSVQQTADNGYIVTGHMWTDFNENVFLIKTDSNGNEEWHQTFGGSNTDRGYSVQQTTDGGYIITGETYSFGNGGSDVWLIKTASNGDSLWTRTIGGTASDKGNAVQQTADGGYIIAGNTPHFNESRVLLIKTDSLGNVDLGTELVINEIMQNPSAVSDENGEWFEIFNSGNFTWDLNEWTIKDAGTDNHTTSSPEWSSLYINPGEYLVLGNNSDYNTNGGVNVDYQYSGISLANSTDEIILINTYGTVFDSVAYDGGTTFPDPNGASMALVHPDSNNNVGTNWQESTTIYGDGDLGTPGTPNFSSDISIDLLVLDFDTVFVNESSTLNLTITNNGNVPLQIDSLYTSSDLFTLSIDNSLIETSAILSITYIPVEFGSDTGNAYIASNDPDESLVVVSLSGFGYYPSPDIELESTTLDFGDVMDGLTGIELFEIYNTGETALEIDTVYCTGNFSVMPGSGTVDASDTLALEVTFAPDDESSFTGTMTIVAGNDPTEDTLTVSLLGTGIAAAPDVVVSPGTLDFGVEIVPGDTIMRQLIIYSTGVQTLEVEEIDFMNSDSNATLWTNFEDNSLEPGDSVIVDIYFHSPDTLYYSISTISIVTNVGSIPITAIAGYYIKISDVTEDATNPINVEILMNNDLPIALFYFEIDIPGDTLTLVNNSLMNTERTSEFSLDGTVMDNGNIAITGIATQSDLEPGIGSICSFTLDNNYNLENTYTLSFLEYAIQDENNVEIEDVIYRDGIITIVNLPPNPPTGISAEFNDGILLTWNENNEDDFSHYVLDKSNDELFETGQYSSITTTETSYLDTVYEDSQVLYYRLSAVDSAGNISDFSDVISIDLSPPSPPTGLSVEFDGGILLSWNANSESDFLHYILDKAADSLFQTDQYSSITTTETFYLDTVYEDDATIYYRLSAVDTDGFVSEFSELVLIHVVLGIDDKLIPEVFALHQNYPNPFNPTTQIKYDLPEDAMVNIIIYDIMGRVVNNLVSSQQTAGYKSVQWNATNNTGQPVSAGLYIYTIQTGDFRQTRKMVLLK